MRFFLCLFLVFLLQACTAADENQLKRNTILFFDPVYYMYKPKYPCVDIKDVIECNWDLNDSVGKSTTRKIK